MSEQNPQPKVFLCSSHGDRDAATKVFSALKNLGVSVFLTFPSPKMASPSELFSAAGLSSRDYVVLLLSPNAVMSSWVMKEAAYALEKEVTARDITLLPVLIADTEIPPFLKDVVYLDCRKDIEEGIERLAEIISTAPKIDFSQLTWEQFEDLVADLLTRLGFDDVDKGLRLKGYRFDIKAAFSRRDPFEGKISETWLVDCKFYKRERSTLKSIKEFLSSLSTLSPDIYGLLVTNGQLTSAAQEYLEILGNELRANVRVVDGTKLKRLLMKHRYLVNKYFPGDEAERHESGE